MNNAWIWLILCFLSVEHIKTCIKLKHGIPIFAMASLTMSCLGWINTLMN